MPSEYRFRCGLGNGLHARPASLLAEVARRFSGAVTMAKGEGPAVDLRSVLSVVGLDVKGGEEVVVAASGPDAEAAIAAVRRLVEERLCEGDDEPVVATAHAVGVAVRLPMGLRRLKVPHAPGRAVCGGIGSGAVVIIDGLQLPAEARAARPESVEAELKAARGAAEAVRQDLRKRAAAARGRMESDLLRAHAEIADDPSLWGEVERRVYQGATSAQAVVGAAEEFVGRLRGAASAYIRDRAVDVQDVCMQLLDRLMEGRLESMHVGLDSESVVFAETLTANQLLRLDKKRLKGLVLGRIGATAHTVILARSLSIPTLIDVAGPARLARAGDEALVDGDGGFVLAPITDGARRYYERERRTRKRRLDRLIPAANRRAVTTDGRELEVGANASSADEIKAAIAQGADGVGLFRTEFLFLERDAPPTEDEQAQAYSAAVLAAAGKPVIFRTFDIGGDKPAPYLRMEREENPFLGVRGLRLYGRHPDLLRSQLRALLRASAGPGDGMVKIMAPMVAAPAEAAWFRAQVREAAASLRAEGKSSSAGVPVGVMIEIPAAAMIVDQLGDEVDFFSIGTNDLCQYCMAVDRGNAGVASLYNPRQPSFLRLLRKIVQGAKARGKWIGVCGEMAGERINLPLMIGLGVNEISVAPGDCLALKAILLGVEAVKCDALLRAALDCKDAAAVEELLAGVSLTAHGPMSVVDRELIEVGVDAATKEEAIKDAVDLLYIAGRTERARDVEEAVWAREETYSTGLGYGFAIPHCKTDAVHVPTLAVLKLKHPVEWGSNDGKPVSVVMLLVIPAAEGAGAAHMKVLAKLARKLMHEEFRARMLAARDAAAIEACLRKELELG